MDKLIATRKYEGKEYQFYVKTSYSITTGKEYKYIVCYTPENAAGISDIVCLDSNYEPYTFYRYCPNWILRKIRSVILQLSLQYITESSKAGR